MTRLALRDGCNACNRRWNLPDSEGQCSRCKRCLFCCGLERVAYSCAWRAARKTLVQQSASKKAYDKWAANPNMLFNNRRIGC